MCTLPGHLLSGLVEGQKCPSAARVALNRAIGWRLQFPQSDILTRKMHGRSGSKATVWRCADHFWSTPINGHRQTGPTGPVRANKRLMHRSKQGVNRSPHRRATGSNVGFRFRYRLGSLGDANRVNFGRRLTTKRWQVKGKAELCCVRHADGSGALPEVHL
jgi:hypothetical protein